MYPRLFNIDFGRQQGDSAPKVGILKKSSSIVISMAFSPRCKYIATGFDSGEFWFWDHESGEILSQWRARENEPRYSVVSIVFSADGQLVYCCYENGRICILDVNTKETINDPHNDILEGECFWCTVSSDGRYIAFDKFQELHSRLFLLCDRKSRQKLMQFASISYPVFSLKGDMLAFVNQSHELCLWSIGQQALFHSWEGCDTLALTAGHIAFSRDSIIEIWDLHTLTRIREFRTTAVYSLRFAGYRHLLIYHENMYTTWNVLTGDLIVEISLGGSTGMIAVSPDLEYIALAQSDDVIYICRSVGHTDPAEGIKYSL